MASHVVAFTGKSSILRSDFFPEIVFDPDENYECGLLDFTTYNSIPNIIRGQNSHFGFKYKIEEKKKVNGKETINVVTKAESIAFDTGSYEVEDILKNLKFLLGGHRISFTFDVCAGSSKVRIAFGSDIEWIGGTLLNVIGFKKELPFKFTKGLLYTSDTIVRITDIDLIRVECDIVTNSYINGQNCRSLYAFSHCKVKPGFKFIEVPQHVIYLPITEKRLRSIQISIVDQDGRLIDFRGEQISCRIHIRKADRLNN